MTAFNPGDRVHVSFDGVVVAHASNAPVSWLVKCNGVQFWVRPEHLSPVPTPVLFADINKGDRIRAVIVPPVPPEPEYEVGAVYQSPLGGIFRRFPDCWQDFDGTKHPHDFPARPLVRLVPEEPK